MQTETLTFQLVAIALIDESPLNPRKHFDPTTLAELAESLRRSGMLEPVTVRPTADDRFELASGHRRYRAAKLAGLEEIPAIIRPMTQEEFVEMLTVANLQRDNVHPLEQALAYQEMITSLRWDVATIARRVSRDKSAIYRTLKFLSLSDGARELFGTDRIPTDIATELARLPVDAQDRAIDPASLAIWERTFADIDQEEIELDEVEDPFRGYKLRTVNEFKEWIQRHVFFHPAEADPVLFPEVVAAFQEAEAEERKVVSITHSLNVHPDAKATGERIYGPQLWRDASQKACASTVLGVIAAGRQQGRAFNVCLNKRSCETHWKAEIEYKRRQEQQAAAAGAGGTAAPHKETDWERQQRILVEKNAQAETALPAVLKAFATAIKQVPVSALVDRITAACAQGGFRVAGSQKGERPEFALVKRGRSADDQLRWLAWSTMVDELRHETEYDVLVEFGKELDVDVKKLIKAAQPKPEKAKQPTKAKT